MGIILILVGGYRQKSRKNTTAKTKRQRSPPPVDTLDTRLGIQSSAGLRGQARHTAFSAPLRFSNRFVIDPLTNLLEITSENLYTLRLLRAGTFAKTQSESSGTDQQLQRLINSLIRTRFGRDSCQTRGNILGGAQNPQVAEPVVSETLVPKPNSTRESNPSSVFSTGVAEMQQTERKSSSRQSNKNSTSSLKASRPATANLPLAPGCALRSFLFSANAPAHILEACEELLSVYRQTYSSVSERSLLQYVVSDLLTPSMPITRLHRYLSSCPATPGEVLAELCRCGHAEILSRIAENPNASEETLTDLSCDPEVEVRCSVVENENTPITVIWLLSTDPSDDVRYRQAECLHTPIRIVMRFLTDENPYIAQRARKTLTMHGHPTTLE